MARKVIPLAIGGSYSAGDAALIPSGMTRLQRNVQSSPGSIWPKRPPFVSDYATSSNADFALWEDNTTRTQRLVAVDLQVTAADHKLYVKSSSSESYGSAVTGTTLAAPHRLLDFTNYRGRMIYAIQRESNGNHALPLTFDGTNAPTTLYQSGPSPMSVTSFIDRIFYGGGQLAVTNGLGATAAYATGTWTLTNVTSLTVTNGTASTVRVVPTHATASVMRSATVGVDGTAAGLGVRYIAAFRPASGTVEMPITLRIRVTLAYANAAVINGSVIMRPSVSNGFIYKSDNSNVVILGPEPAWPTTLGATVADPGGFNWTCVGTEVIGESEFTLPVTSEQGDFRIFGVNGSLLIPYASTGVSAEVAFRSSSTPSITVDTPLDFSFKDGLTDGDVRKRNFGHQVTVGLFEMPFFNQESSATATVDVGDIIHWSEPGDPGTVFGQNTYRLRDTAGRITGVLAPLDGRIVAFKRQNATTFVPNEADPDNPITRERNYAGDGLLHPRAMDIHGNTVYGIGENYVWAWRPGSEFVDICDDGMRDEIMDKSAATWVESQATYNVPILTIDQTRKIVYVYTQKGKIFGYRITSKEWFRYDVNNSGFEVRDMLWLKTTGKLYVSFGGQQSARLDHTVTNQADAVNNSGTTYTIVTQTDLPVEFRGPQYDVILDRVNAYIKATADQTGQVFYVYVSTDQGATFTLYNEITLPVGSGQYERIPIDLYQCYPSFVIRLQHEGNGGGVNYTLSSAEAEINVMAGAFPRTLPSGVGSNLT